MINVPTTNYHAGRLGGIRLIVLHTAECPCEAGRAKSTLEYLARPAVQASAHYATDPTTTCSQVAEDDTAWAAPGANSDGIQIEQAGYAGWGPAEWALPEAVAMMRNTAALVADISRRRGIPLVHLTNAQLAAGASGVIHHVQAAQVYQLSDHWDCGPNYPIDQVIAWATGTGGTVPPDVPTPKIEDDEMLVQFYTDPIQVVAGRKGSGSIYVAANGECWALRDDTTRDVLEKTGQLKPGAQHVSWPTPGYLVYKGIWEDRTDRVTPNPG